MNGALTFLELSVLWLAFLALFAAIERRHRPK